jgi:hypothetical protein
MKIPILLNYQLSLITAPDKLVTILSDSAWQALTKKNHVLYISCFTENKLALT